MKTMFTFVTNMTSLEFLVHWQARKPCFVRPRYLIFCTSGLFLTNVHSTTGSPAFTDQGNKIYHSQRDALQSQGRPACSFTSQCLHGHWTVPREYLAGCERNSFCTNLHILMPRASLADSRYDCNVPFQHRRTVTASTPISCQCLLAVPQIVHPNLVTYFQTHRNTKCFGTPILFWDLCQQLWTTISSYLLKS